MPNPQYNKFLKQIRDNDPTRENGFVANILETPKAKEERLRAHRFSALKLYHEECLRERLNGRLRKRQMQCELNPKLEEMRSVAGAVKRPRPRRRVQGSFISSLQRLKPHAPHDSSAAIVSLSASARSKARSIISRGAMPNLSLASRQ
mgnify:CR=1 FL=1